MARQRTGRGGPRTPAKPAPVSGPGGLSRRTDGGPGQPVRSFPAQFQGQRKQLAEQQAAAPMERAGTSGTPSGGSRPQPADPLSVFGATERPMEPATSGIPFGPGNSGPNAMPEDTLLVLQAIGAAYPSEAITKLMSYVMSDRQTRGG